MDSDPKDIYTALMTRFRADGFAGWDPFDGLESKVFQATPLRRLAAGRVAWLQMVKRSPWNLRPVLGVPKGLNSKGIALFALAEIGRFRATGGSDHKAKAAELLGLLRTLALTTPNGMAFGYNFDWQSRAFFAPKGTPTIVPTAFAARAFIEGFYQTGDEHHLEIARNICRFIVGDLRRPHENDREVCFSYTPGDVSLIYNASLLAAEILAEVGTIEGSEEYLALAEKAARYVTERQGDRGEWAYGPKLRHAWIDNFHTAFILSSLVRIGTRVKAVRNYADSAVAKGFNLWIENFFTEEGAPKYFDNKLYPIDIHSAAAALVTLADFADRDERAVPLAEVVLRWTISNMWSGDDHFYYQKRQFMTVRTPFVRWAQAWMAYGIARLMEVREAH